MAGALSLAVLNISRTRDCADAHEHLNKFRSANAVERHAGLTGHGAGQQCLAGARRADQQHALGHHRAQTLKLLRRTQKLDHLLQLALGVLHAGHVLEGDAHLAAFVAARRAFDVVAQKAAAQRIAETRQQEKKHRQYDHQRQNKDQERVHEAKIIRLLRQLHVFFLHLFLQARQQTQIVEADALDGEFFAAAQLLQRFFDGVRQIVGTLVVQFAADAIAADDDFLEFMLAEEHPEIAPVDGSSRTLRTEDEIEDQQGQHDDPEKIASHAGSGTTARFRGRRSIGIRRGIGGHKKSSWRSVGFTFLVPVPSASAAGAARDGQGPSPGNVHIT